MIDKPSYRKSVCVHMRVNQQWRLVFSIFLCACCSRAGFELLCIFEDAHFKGNELYVCLCVSVSVSVSVSMCKCVSMCVCVEDGVTVRTRVGVGEREE